MKRIRLFMLVLVLLLALPPATFSEDFDSLGEVNRGIYWNREFSIGCDLGEGWTFSSQEELAAVNNNSDNTRTLMTAEYQGAAVVVLDAYYPGSEKLSRADEDEYLKFQQQLAQEAYEGIGMKNLHSNIDTIAFLEGYHTGLSISGMYDDGMNFFQTIAAAAYGDVIIVATAYSFSKDITGLLLDCFFRCELLLNSGEIIGDTYWNDTLSLGFTKALDWMYYTEGELQAFNAASFGTPKNGLGVAAVMMAASEGMKDSVSIRVSRMPKENMENMDELDFIAQLNNSLEDGLLDSLERAGLTNISTSIEEVFFLDGNHHRFHNVGQKDGRCFYQTVQVMKRENEFLTLIAISWDEDTTSENLNQFFNIKGDASFISDTVDQNTASLSTQAISQEGVAAEVSNDRWFDYLSFGFSGDSEFQFLDTMEGINMSLEEYVEQMDTNDSLVVLAAGNEKTGELIQVQMMKLGWSEPEGSFAAEFESVVDVVADQSGIEISSREAGVGTFMGEEHPWISAIGIHTKSGQKVFTKFYFVSRGESMLIYVASSYKKDATEEILNRCYSSISQ